jgi:spore coat polysaccharide biosynthesis predicted glycosyltransferase SpsG
MSEPPLIEIFCEGNEHVGYGHIRRALTLAARLERDGVDVRISGLSANARQMLPELKHAGRIAQIVIFDSPLGIDDQIRVAHDRGQISVALDWFGETIPNVNIAVYHHGEVHATREAYVGFEYALVREDIASLHRAQPTGRANRVLVILGGGDLLGQGHDAARSLHDYGLDVTLIQGPYAKATEAGAGYNVLITPPELPQLLNACDWAVTNGGGCFIEALCLGKAAFVLPQSEAEMRFARFAEDKGALLGIGIDNLRRFYPDELGAVAECGVKLVDGRGAERVSVIVRGLL